MTLPTVALSIRQPWAWLIVNGLKDIENRDWRTNYRGPVLIHAGKAIDHEAFDDLAHRTHPVTGQRLAKSMHDAFAAGFTEAMSRGGIVGVAEIRDCVDHHESSWFVGRYGFVMSAARPLPFRPLKGALGFFKARYD